MLDAPPPVLSAILLTPDKANRLQTTLGHLSRQTIADQLEVVLVAPDLERLDLGAVNLQAFHSHQVVTLGRQFTLGEGYVAAARQATAPLVVMCEDHSWPAPDWAEHLVAAHAMPYAAVGPVMMSANPESKVGWADLFVCFGPFVYPTPSGVLPSLAGHNTCYKRKILLNLDGDLVSQFEPEVLLHATMAAAGYQLFLAGDARTAHVNFSSVRAMTIKQILAGRRYAHHRSRSWPRRRRLLYFAGSPLLPIIGLRRTWAQVRKPGRYAGSPLGLIPWLM